MMMIYQGEAFMVGWQITAKTIYCDAVDDEVTLLIYKDKRANCTGYKKYNQPNAITVSTIKRKTKSLKRPVKCEGEDCSRLSRYKENILTEEAK